MDILEQIKSDADYVQRKKAKLFDNLSTHIEKGDALICVTAKSEARGLDRMTLLLDSLEQIALDEKLTNSDRKVLLFLISQAGFENIISISQLVMAERLKMDKADISRAVKRLQEGHYLLVKKVGRQMYYTFNPEHGWKGKSSQWGKVVDFKELKARQEAKGFRRFHLPLPGLDIPPKER